MKNNLIVLLTIVTMLNICNVSLAQSAIFRKLIRTAGRVADDVPLKPMEKAIKTENKTMARELLEKTGKSVDKTLPYSKQLLREIEKTVPGIDKSVLKSLDEAGEAGVETALLLSKGANGVSNTIPDIARRAELLRTLDADTLCVIGRYGDDITDSAELFLKSTADGKIIKLNIDPSLVKNVDGIASAKRAVTMGDFNNFFRKTGDAGAEFWRKTVKPHWKLFAMSGVMAAILIAPESYTDYVIEGTKEAGFKIVHTVGKVLDAGGEVAAETVKTTSESASKAVKKCIEEIDKGLWEIIKSFFSSVTVKVITIIIVVIGLIWFFSLSLVQNCIRWLFNGIRKILRWFKRPPKKLGSDVE